MVNIIYANKPNIFSFSLYNHEGLINCDNVTIEILKLVNDSYVTVVGPQDMLPTQNNSRWFFSWAVPDDPVYTFYLIKHVANYINAFNEPKEVVWYYDYVIYPYPVAQIIDDGGGAGEIADLLTSQYNLLIQNSNSNTNTLMSNQNIGFQNILNEQNFLENLVDQLIQTSGEINSNTDAILGIVTTTSSNIQLLSDYLHNELGTLHDDMQHLFTEIAKVADLIELLRDETSQYYNNIIQALGNISLAVDLSPITHRLSIVELALNDMYQALENHDTFLRNNINQNCPPANPPVDLTPVLDKCEDILLITQLTKDCCDISTGINQQILDVCNNITCGDCPESLNKLNEILQILQTPQLTPPSGEPHNNYVTVSSSILNGETQNPIPGLSVKVYPYCDLTNLVTQTHTNESGEFSFNVGIGEYLIRISGPTYQNDFSLLVTGLDQTTFEFIPVDVNSCLDNGSGSVTVSDSVLTPEGVPIAGVLVEFYQSDILMASSLTNSEGIFTVYLDPGIYKRLIKNILVHPIVEYEENIEVYP